MLSSKRPIVALSALFFFISFIFIADGLIVSSASILMRQIGVGDAQIGLVNACFFAGAIACTITAHRLVSALGHVRAYGVYTALFAVVCLLHNVSSNLIFWMILRFILGYTYYSLVMVTESWVNAKALNQNRSRVLAFYEIVFYVCFGLGTLFIALNLTSNEVFLIAAIFIILGSVPLNFLKIRTPPVPPKTRMSVPNVFKIAPLALTTSFVGGLAMNGFFSMASLFVIAQGFGAEHAAGIIVAGMAGGFVSHLIFGPISDKMGRKFAIILAASIALGVALVFVLAKPNLIMQYALTVLFGVIFTLYALALARANDVVSDKSKCIEVSRTQLFNYLVGSCLSAPVIGVLIEIFGAMGFMYFYVATLGFLVVFAAFQKSVPSSGASPNIGGQATVFEEIK